MTSYISCNILELALWHSWKNRFNKGTSHSSDTRKHYRENIIYSRYIHIIPIRDGCTTIMSQALQITCPSSYCGYVFFSLLPNGFNVHIIRNYRHLQFFSEAIIFWTILLWHADSQVRPDSEHYISRSFSCTCTFFLVVKCLRDNAKDGCKHCQQKTTTNSTPQYPPYLVKGY